MNVQQKNYSRKERNPARKKLLTELGFKDANLEQQWMDKYDELKMFINVNGHDKVKKSYNKELYGWIHRQKELYKKNKLIPKRQQLLVEINLFE